MRKVLLLAVVAALALALAPAHADAQCVIAGVEMGNDGDIGESCVFQADGNPHGYAAAIPNDFLIWGDLDADLSIDPGEPVYADVSPTDGDPLVAQLTIPTGASATVAVINGCAGPACGWVGALIVR